MPGENTPRPKGRARARPLGRARVGRVMGVAATPERARTQVVRRDGDRPQQVFVDTSGRRRQRLRRVAYVVGLLAVVAIAVLWLSQYGGPVGPVR
jgi:hypothetical protein